MYKNIQQNYYYTNYPSVIYYNKVRMGYSKRYIYFYFCKIAVQGTSLENQLIYKITDNII